MRCEKMVWKEWNHYQCPNPAKYDQFCGIHSPEKQAEREKKRGPTKWERECAERKRRQTLLDAVLKEARFAADAVDELGGLRSALHNYDED